MTLFSLIVALLLEQWQPLSARKLPFDALTSYVNFFQNQLNAGERRHGRIAWSLAVLVLVAGIGALYYLLDYVHPLLGLAFCVLVLYLTMGFRLFSHYFTDIHHALRADDLLRARTLLSDWRGIPSHELDSSEVARLAIEEALLASHRHVFGVAFWFIAGMLAGIGPAGAALYRMAQFLCRRWGALHGEDHGEFGQFARLAYHWIEWLPLRLTAITFAIVGDFEDAVYCWRTQANTWPDPEAGIVLASGAGALGVRLGQPIPDGGLLLDRPELGTGDDADVDFMQSTIGLAWRTLVFMLLLLLLLTLSSLVG